MSATFYLCEECLIKNERIKKLEGLLIALIDDIETPSRLGIGASVNPKWTTFNNAKEYLKEMKK